MEINHLNKEKIREILLLNKKIYIFKDKDKFFISDKKEDSKPFVELPENNFPGDNIFMERFGLKYPYIAGAMAKGISSIEMAEELSKTGCLANFGSAGLSNKEILEKIDVLKSRADKFGINMINIPGNQENELELVRALIDKKVHVISCGAYIRMTPGIVLFRVKGIKEENGELTIPNKIIGKISRLEIAKTFFSPPPKKIIKKLLEESLITEKEAELSQSIPMASDIIAEADSGGHTDKQPAISLFPQILNLKNKAQKNFCKIKLSAGLAGGIGTPESLLAAFSMGADFVVTGSINQACVESGTSGIVKEMLSKASQSDFELVPSADTFEIGGKVQVLKKGNKFAQRAKFLEKIFNEKASIEELHENDVEFLESKILGNKIEAEWESTKKYFSKINPKTIETAENNPKKKMALIFKSYLGKSSSWAINGNEERKDDFQIWSGQSIAAFNSWAENSYLESHENRRVSDVALNLLKASNYLYRINFLNNLGIKIPDELKTIKPIKQL